MSHRKIRKKKYWLTSLYETVWVNSAWYQQKCHISCIVGEGLHKSVLFLTRRAGAINVKWTQCCTIWPLHLSIIGYDAQIIRVSSDPVRAFKGSDAVFQWVLSKDLTSRPDFQGLVFGLWKNGYLATYLTTVTKARRIILNPGLKDEAPHLEGRVQWRGDLSKSLAAFQISQVNAKDQMDYGLVLNFGPYRNSLSDSVRLEVKGKRRKNGNIFTLNKYYFTGKTWITTNDSKRKRLQAFLGTFWILYAIHTN